MTYDWRKSLQNKGGKGFNNNNDAIKHYLSLKEGGSAIVKPIAYIPNDVYSLIIRSRVCFYSNIFGIKLQNKFEYTIDTTQSYTKDWVNEIYKLDISKEEKKQKIGNLSIKSQGLFLCYVINNTCDPEQNGSIKIYKADGNMIKAISKWMYPDEVEDNKDEFKPITKAYDLFTQSSMVNTEAMLLMSFKKVSPEGTYFDYSVNSKIIDLSKPSFNVGDNQISTEKYIPALNNYFSLITNETGEFDPTKLMTMIPSYYEKTHECVAKNVDAFRFLKYYMCYDITQEVVDDILAGRRHIGEFRQTIPTVNSNPNTDTFTQNQQMVNQTVASAPAFNMPATQTMVNPAPIATAVPTFNMPINGIQPTAIAQPVAQPVTTATPTPVAQPVPSFNMSTTSVVTPTQTMVNPTPVATTAVPTFNMPTNGTQTVTPTFNIPSNNNPISSGLKIGKDQLKTFNVGSDIAEDDIPF